MAGCIILIQIYIYLTVYFQRSVFDLQNHEEADHESDNETTVKMLNKWIWWKFALFYFWFQFEKNVQSGAKKWNQIFSFILFSIYLIFQVKRVNFSAPSPRKMGSWSHYSAGGFTCQIGFQCNHGWIWFMYSN